ncbi:hypothetical protein Rsub_05233 [Raphidocelis subcapitata]|uniref:Uncharacterized protein n=1 Tax=Raphidocelis subcapitata TaxID=307507 RepID=A0A2V0NZ72_9CHLO|nr:hypothetical protein Rsub_05233 [Raphidocelis subcapitata]|eukprot:GBF92619.1 hypothetical protein Rsub_05233 [Raphidocelis subcapitata]
MELLDVGAMNRLKQLRAVRILLREEHRQRDEAPDAAAVGSSGNASGGGDAGPPRPATAAELRRIGDAIARLSEVLDQDLAACEREVDARGASVARDLEAADKLDEAVDSLLSAGTLAGELLSTRPYRRGAGTLTMGPRPAPARGCVSGGGAASLAAAAVASAAAAPAAGS